MTDVSRRTVLTAAGLLAIAPCADAAAPAVSSRLFGVLDNGVRVRAARLRAPGGLDVEIIEYGAIISRLDAPAPRGMTAAVLGFDTLDDYVRDMRYQGGVVGRVANRIARAQFTLDGVTHRLSANRDGDCLHGGHVGFNKRVWRLARLTRRPHPAAMFTYRSAHLEEGFPGAVDATVTYTLAAPDTLHIQFTARTDRPTPVNLSNHLYFNLTGDRTATILDHELSIAAPAITPIDAGAIPTGEIMPVTGTPFDLNQPRRIRDILAAEHPQLATGGGLNHNWVLARGAPAALTLRAPGTGLRMIIATDQPGMQIFDGRRLGEPFVKYGGLVIEPQNFPDAVNHPTFPVSILRPGEVYRASSTYRFDAA